MTPERMLLHLAGGFRFFAWRDGSQRLASTSRVTRVKRNSRGGIIALELRENVRLEFQHACPVELLAPRRDPYESTWHETGQITHNGRVVIRFVESFSLYRSVQDERAELYTIPWLRRAMAMLGRESTFVPIEEKPG